MAGPDDPFRLRLAGLVATLLVAAGAYGAGALPGTADGSRPDAYPAGFAATAAGVALLAVVGWRLDRLLRRDAGRTSGRWLVGTAALWAAPLLVAPPIGSRDVYSYACQGWLWQDGADPYAVGAAAGGCPWTDAVAPLWRDTPAPYGPLAVALAGAAVAVARAVTTGDGAALPVAVVLLRLVALGGALLVAACGPRLARVCGVDPRRAALLGVVTPVVAVHGVGGAHLDLLVAGLTVAALGAALRGGRRAAVVAGVLVGLATAVKVTAAVALPFVALLAVAAHPGPHRGPDPHRRPMIAMIRDFVGRVVGVSPHQVPDHRAPAAVVAGAAGGFAAISLATGLGLGWLAALPDSGRLGQWTSLPTGIGMAAGYLLRALGRPEAYPGAVAVARLLGLVLLAGTVAVLVRRAARAAATSVGHRVPDRHGSPEPAAGRDRCRTVITACGAALAAVALLGPVFYPWYALGALAVLTVCVHDERARRWLAGAAVVPALLVLPGGLGLATLTKLPGALLDVVAVATAGWLAHRHRHRRPADDRGDRGRRRATHRRHAGGSP